MTHTANTIVIAAAPETIYRFASDTGRWAEYLPHYRYVNVLHEEGPMRIVEMAALRDAIPIRWTAAQWNDPQTPSIRFVHLRGWTRGMDVRWRFEPAGPALTRVSIEHDLSFRFPFAADLIGEHIVGNYFIKDVASKTLARMKVLSENLVAQRDPAEAV